VDDNKLEEEFTLPSEKLSTISTNNDRLFCITLYNYVNEMSVYITIDGS